MNVVDASLAAKFWAVVPDCLVEFHQMSRPLAAEKVTSAWSRLPRTVELDSEMERPTTNGQDRQSFDDIIYHAEPWYVACNLAGDQVDLANYRSQYDHLLQSRGLA